MADAIYDAVVIGGGHHGTIIACYLQNAGLETAVFERQHELGGGACGEELPVPGFLMNPCAHAVRFYGHPAYADFKLWEHGLEHIFPELGSGVIFDDETCIVAYPAWKVADRLTGRAEFSPENAESTFGEIARFSERDAETAQILLHKYRNKWREAYTEYLFTAPTPWGEKDGIERLFDDPEYGIDPAYQFMTTAQIGYDLFESEEMRAYFIRGMKTTSETFPEDVLPVCLNIHALALILSWSPVALVRGGTHAITHALQRAFSSMGGKFFVHHEVDKIIIEDGAAKGIRLIDGTEIEARKLVVADVDIHQLLFRLIGKEYVSSAITRKVEDINYDRGQIVWGDVAIHEPPRYKAVSFNPDCEEIPRLYLMPKDVEYLVEKYKRDIYSRGFAQKLYLWTMADSKWDKIRAPEDKHIIKLEDMSCPLRYFSDREWIRIGKDFVKEAVRQWQIYAPNMNMDNVIGSYVSTPFSVVNRNINMRGGSIEMGAPLASQWGRLRPIPELSGYRMPIKNVYLCSSSAHPGVGIGRGSSYICYKVIAQDLGLRRIWEEKGRAY